MLTQAITRFISVNNYPQLAPKAFFFDMDGVLFDSMPRHAKAWVETMRQIGIEFSEYDAFLNEGQTGRRIIDIFIRKHFGRPSTVEEQEKYYRLKSDLFDAGGAPEPIAGVAEVLNALKNAGMQIFVVTGSGQASLLGKLEHSFPGIFQKEKMVTAHDVQHGKPDPAARRFFLGHRRPRLPGRRADANGAGGEKPWKSGALRRTSIWNSCLTADRPSCGRGKGRALSAAICAAAFGRAAWPAALR